VKLVAPQRFRKARRWVAAAALVAGVGVLAGPGWALLAAGVALWLTT